MQTAANERADLARWQRLLLPSGLLADTGSRRSARDWVVDVALFAFAVAVGAAVLATSWDQHAAATATVDVALGTIACLALWRRRQNPTAVGVLSAGFAGISAAAGGAGLVVIFNAAIRSSPRGLAVVVGVGLVAAAVYAGLYPGDGAYDWGGLVIGFLLTVVAVGWGLFVRSRRALIASLRERNERLEAEQQLQAEQARAAERRRIAREMHDVLAHRLSLLSVHAGALEFRPDAPAAEVARAAAVIRSAAHAALEELRAVIGVLREDGEAPGAEPPQPTLAELPVLIDESRAAGMHVSCRIDVPDDAEVPDALGRTAYRIVQEGLTNARKHAPGAAVEVTVTQLAGTPLQVEVANRAAVRVTPGGVPGAGTGLIGLSERVALAGGELVHGPASGGDYVLRASLP
jgi:signal transduction histidine kinase